MERRYYRERTERKRLVKSREIGFAWDTRGWLWRPRAWRALYTDHGIDFHQRSVRWGFLTVAVVIAGDLILDD